MLLIAEIADILLTVVKWGIIIQVVLSWLLAFNVLNTASPAVRSFAVTLDRLTAPLYRPIRRLLPDFGGIDFSPLVILIAVQLIQSKVIQPLELQQIYGA